MLQLVELPILPYLIQAKVFGLTQYIPRREAKFSGQKQQAFVAEFYWFNPVYKTASN